MRRREFIGLLGSAAAWPVTAHAQQAMPVIGFLHSGTAEANAKRVAGLRKGLSDAGLVEGQNVAIEFRWAGGQDARLAELAADLVRRQVAVIVTPASTQAAFAAKAATSTIPVVFAVGGDPVAQGFVASLNRPGGNLTGISILNVELAGKRLGLLRELAPKVTRLGVLINPDSAMTRAIVRNVEAGAPAANFEVEFLHASSDRDIAAIFENLPHKPFGALLVNPDEFLFTRYAQIIALAARHGIPAIAYGRELAEIGALMSYGPDIVQVFAQVGGYAARILKGEKPADLPVVQSTKIEMAFNLKVAKALGIEIPDRVLALADEVIE